MRNVLPRNEKIRGIGEPTVDMCWDAVGPLHGMRFASSWCLYEDAGLVLISEELAIGRDDGATNRIFGRIRNDTPFSAPDSPHVPWQLVHFFIPFPR